MQSFIRVALFTVLIALASRSARASGLRSDSERHLLASRGGGQNIHGASTHWFGKKVWKDDVVKSTLVQSNLGTFHAAEAGVDGAMGLVGVKGAKVKAAAEIKEAAANLKNVGSNIKDAVELNNGALVDDAKFAYYNAKGNTAEADKAKAAQKKEWIKTGKDVLSDVIAPVQAVVGEGQMAVGVVTNNKTLEDKARNRSAQLGGPDDSASTLERRAQDALLFCSLLTDRRAFSFCAGQVELQDGSDQFCQGCRYCCWIRAWG